MKPNVDILISDVPQEHYERIRKDLIKKGYEVQGYQRNYCQPSGKKIEK